VGTREDKGYHLSLARRRKGEILYAGRAPAKRELGRREIQPAKDLGEIRYRSGETGGRVKGNGRTSFEKKGADAGGIRPEECVGARGGLQQRLRLRHTQCGSSKTVKKKRTRIPDQKKKRAPQEKRTWIRRKEGIECSGPSTPVSSRIR